jgi:hypothetical protein
MLINQGSTLRIVSSSAWEPPCIPPDQFSCVRQTPCLVTEVVHRGQAGGPSLVQMGTKAANATTWHPKEVMLIGLTLITSAVHFTDNAFRLDLYPGPAWLTRNVVLAAWIVMLLAACLVYCINTRTALVAYGVLGFAGLVHYVMPQAGSMPTRCALTIGAEAASSVLLIAYAVLRSRMNPLCRY